MVHVPRRRRRRGQNLLQWHSNQTFKRLTLRLIGVLLFVCFVRLWWTRTTVIHTGVEDLLLHLHRLAIRGQSSRKLSNLIVATTPISTEDITLVTQTSANKLDMLLLQMERWQGPVSCAVYIQTSKHIDSFLAFLKKLKDSQQQTTTTLHVMFEPPNRDYPMNELRNLAMNAVQSDYLLVMDVDFLTDARAYTSLKSALQTDADFRHELHTKTAFVLPAFERFTPRQLGQAGGDNTISMDMIPPDKQELLQAIAQRKAAPFHEQFGQGHGPTNYTRWFSEETENSYSITFALRFEPYVLVHRHGLPQFWPGFRGFGYNKASWCCEMHYLGYAYKVLVNHFVIHRNHEYASRRQNQETLQEWRNFKHYMIETYGVHKEVFRDYADGYGNAKWREYIGGNNEERRPWYRRIVDK